MNYSLIVVLFIVSFSVLFGSQIAYATTEQVFFEDFDGGLAGWTESLCNRNDVVNQVCIIGLDTQLLDLPNELPESLPNWGFVEITATGGSLFVPVEVRFEKSFTVFNEDDYIVSAWLGIKDCNSCNIATQLYVDGTLALESIGPDIGVVPAGPHKSFQASAIHLTAGTHTIEMTMRSTAALNGQFRASFDDIRISRDIPTAIECGDKTELNSNNQCVPDLDKICGMGTVPDFNLLMCFGITMQTVGGELLDINTVSLLVASIGVNPVITGLVGITIAGVAGQAVWFVHRRRNPKNS